MPQTFFKILSFIKSGKYLKYGLEKYWTLYSNYVCFELFMNMPTLTDFFSPDIHPLDAICKDLNIESQVKVIVYVQVKWNLSNSADTGIDIL